MNQSSSSEPIVLMLVGLPGAGKSLFARNLSRINPSFTRTAYRQHNQPDKQPNNQATTKLSQSSSDEHSIARNQSSTPINQTSISTRRWQWLDSDSMNRESMIQSINQSINSDQSIIIDRCNGTRADRAMWIQLVNQSIDQTEQITHSIKQAEQSKRPIDCLYFTTPLDTCVTRAYHRTNHATLSRVKIDRKGGEQYLHNVISAFQDVFEDVDENEGFRSIRLIESLADLKLALIGYGFSPEQSIQNETGQVLSLDEQSINQSINSNNQSAPRIIKFPRTAHLFNTGTTTDEDDVVWSDQSMEASQFYGSSGGLIHVQEKIDGANMGISINPSNNQLVVQNRSHFVNSSTHSQFANLQHWLDEHSNDLYHVLNSNDDQLDNQPSILTGSQPNESNSQSINESSKQSINKPNRIRVSRYILYGEWCRAKHSIHYTKLPDYFLVFDMFDTHCGKFVSLSELRQRLSGTQLQMVPLITSIRFNNRDELMQMVQTKSRFRSDGGFVEGVYLRVDDEKWNVARAKLVRQDFSQAIQQHWSKQQMVKNLIDRSGVE